jgi:hypothetical protein
MKKIFRYPVIFTMCVIFFGSIQNMQAFASPYVSSSFNTASVWVQSDIIEWRYKVIDGKLYRRQYNCTTNKWIGSWKLAE